MILWLIEMFNLVFPWFYFNAQAVWDHESIFRRIICLNNSLINMLQIILSRDTSLSTVKKCTCVWMSVCAWLWCERWIKGLEWTTARVLVTRFHSFYSEFFIVICNHSRENYDQVAESTLQLKFMIKKIDIYYSPIL